MDTDRDQCGGFSFTVMLGALRRELDGVSQESFLKN